MGLREDALKYHSNEGSPGKIGTSILTSVVSKDDLALAYSPGVAFPCLEIASDKSKVYDYTSKGNSVAVVSNGSAVLGLGNIGALAGKPVMEGKALLFKHFAGIDAVDVEVDSFDVDEIVRTVEVISGTYGGINLEDFKAPECFEIEERLKGLLGIPVFHDDQHGTAIVVGAGVLNALKVAGKKIDEVKVVLNGAGAAGVAIGRMLLNLGVLKENLVMCDSRGVIFRGRGGLNKYKMEFAVELGDVWSVPQKAMESSTHMSSCGDEDDGKKNEAWTNTDEHGPNLRDVIRGADVFIGISVKDVLSAEMLKSMAENRIVFALANPDPEIGWDLAHEVCPDVIMATGRSDFPNQVNNVLAFPGIFRGALDCRVGAITEEMKKAAVEALAGLVESPSRDRFIVDPFDSRVVFEVACAVALAADVDGFDLGSYRERLKVFLE